MGHFLRHLSQRLTFTSSTSGVAAVEFGLLLPAIAFIFAATAEFGMASWMKFRLNGAVAAAANYAMQNASSVNSTTGGTIGANLAAFILTSISGATVQIIINNGTTITAGGTAPSGAATNADSFYCPSLSGSTVNWGSSVTSGSACTSGFAGKYIYIKATQSYTSLFSNWSSRINGTLTASIMVQVQ